MWSVQALDEMQAQGHRPDVAVYNVAIETLTRSGVLSAQLKAAQLFQTATRQGQLRCGRHIWESSSDEQCSADVPVVVVSLLAVHLCLVLVPGAFLMGPCLMGSAG
jgi:hypothetical protein